jgi:hypothetical protein
MDEEKDIVEEAKEKMLKDGLWLIRIKVDIVGKKYGGEIFERIATREEIEAIEKAIIAVRDSSYTFSK